MADIREIELAIEHFSSNQDFIRLYNRHNRELLLQHFLLIAAAGDEVWRINQERKMSMPEQRDIMLLKYMEWLEKMSAEFPEVQRPGDVNEDWWRLMLLAYERKPISGKSLWRKFKEDTRNPILSSFNCHWSETSESDPLEVRFKAVRRGVWRDLGHRDDEFLPEGTWLPKQWYAWRYCCYPGKNFRAFDGKLPSVSLGGSRQRSQQQQQQHQNHNHLQQAIARGAPHSMGDAGMNWISHSHIPMNQMQGHDLSGAMSHPAMQQMVADVQAQAQVQGHQGIMGSTTSSSNHNHTGNAVRINRAIQPSTPANQRLLAAAASMSRSRVSSEDELAVQQYLADVQQYMAQMSRLEKAITLAESFGDHEKAVGFKRQLYDHVQTEPPERMRRVAYADSVGHSNGADMSDLSLNNPSTHSNTVLVNSRNMHSGGNDASVGVSDNGADRGIGGHQQQQQQHQQHQQQDSVGMGAGVSGGGMDMIGAGYSTASLAVMPGDSEDHHHRDSTSDSSCNNSDHRGMN